VLAGRIHDPEGPVPESELDVPSPALRQVDPLKRLQSAPRGARYAFMRQVELDDLVAGAPAVVRHIH
jgi:hypothetical protein